MSVDDLLALAGERAQEHASLAPYTTYRVGGAARLLLTLDTPQDLLDVGPALGECGLAVVVVGNGSNLLVAEGEHDIVALHLGEGFRGLDWSDVDGEVVVHAGAALDLPVAARRLSADGVVGFEWAVGVPGTFGGAVAMNAGGHGSDMAASVASVTLWRGQLVSVSAADLHFGYRESALNAGDVVVEVTLRLRRGDADAARAALRDVVAWRRAHQPGGANAGSVFRNPPGDSAGRLIEAVGAKGLRHGSAVVSDKHANFIQVDAGGRANDVYELAREVAERVREATGVDLVFEHRLIGFGGDR
ncbi:MAG TPA: UDP-N-acetylmuramate dehydrogenase [Acidimicrobiales bacterium]|nr:UDP-N-acetylmuramate dehydrogenase [Acidimicrobiales bacterium]